METTKTVKGVQVTARMWKPRDMPDARPQRIYFDAGRQGQACWDVQKREWVKVHGEFGWAFKAAIKAAWEL